ncbi:MAG: hypothetical protein P4L98_12975 [Ancalomicrobiaceae bacterium]|nr:hypothetical protein [Ancalomicrobiaceae bacterium]
MTGSSDLTIDEALADPLIALVMRADGVDAEALRREWTALGATLARTARPTVPAAEPARPAPLAAYVSGRGNGLITDCICANWTRAAAQSHTSKAGPR